MKWKINVVSPARFILSYELRKAVNFTLKKQNKTKTIAAMPGRAGLWMNTKFLTTFFSQNIREIQDM